MSERQDLLFPLRHKDHLNSKGYGEMESAFEFDGVPDVRHGSVEDLRVLRSLVHDGCIRLRLASSHGETNPCEMRQDRFNFIGFPLPAVGGIPHINPQGGSILNKWHICLGERTFPIRDQGNGPNPYLRTVIQKSLTMVHCDIGPLLRLLENGVAKRTHTPTGPGEGHINGDWSNALSSLPSLNPVIVPSQFVRIQNKITRHL